MCTAIIINKLLPIRVIHIQDTLTINDGRNGYQEKGSFIKKVPLLVPLLFQTETRPLLFTLSSHATRTTLFPFYPTTWMLNKFLSPPPPPLINIISATVRWIHPWRTPSSALQWVMITCYIKYHVLNIILMITRDRANHWSSVVYEATFSLTLLPLGSDLVPPSSDRHQVHRLHH